MAEVNVSDVSGIEVGIGQSGKIEIEVDGKIYIAGDCDNYTGIYEVTPKIFAQHLETKEKHLNENVQIEAIPYYEVGNQSGGYTLNIG